MAGWGSADRVTALPVAVTTRALVDALVALTGAGGRVDVADAVLPRLLELPGVRAAAVVERAGSDLVVQGSAGYDCGAMGPGERLPLAAGLPVTEAVRTHRTVVRGRGPGWVAAPFEARGTGALLLSLDGPPPEDLRPVITLARAVGRALRRVRGTEQAQVDLAALTASVALLPDPDPALDVVVRSVPRHGPVGGDVLLALPDGRGGSWLLASDVCGSGVPAALVGRSVAAAAAALAPYSPGPAALLDDLERSLRPVVPPGSFVTALVLHLAADRTAVASAGHPPPLLLRPSGARVVDVPAGPPLALETGRPGAYEQVPVALPSDAVLLLHTDGLTDRHGARDTDPLTLVPAAPGDLVALADRVLAAAERAGPATDDVALMVVRRPG